MQKILTLKKPVSTEIQIEIGEDKEEKITKKNAYGVFSTIIRQQDFANGTKTNISDAWSKLDTSQKDEYKKKANKINAKHGFLTSDPKKKRAQIKKENTSVIIKKEKLNDHDNRDDNDDNSSLQLTKHTNKNISEKKEIHSGEKKRKDLDNEQNDSIKKIKQEKILDNDLQTTSSQQTSGSLTNNKSSKKIKEEPMGVEETKKKSPIHEEIDSSNDDDRNRSLVKLEESNERENRSQKREKLEVPN